MPRKKLSIPSLKKKLQRLVNLYVRLKQSDEGGTCQCITCGKLFHYKEIDAGHFIPSTSTKHRYNTRNIHPQCKRCNRFLHGNLIPYTLYMQEKYGEDYVNALVQTKHEVTKYQRIELDEMIKQYTTLVKDMEEERFL